MERITIVGTGLIGASVGLALKASGFAGTIAAWDANAAELAEAKRLGAFDIALESAAAVLAERADVYVLATPVMGILHWMNELAAVTGEGQLITDVGSTKRDIAELACKLFNQKGKAAFLPGHPMAGKEFGGAALAEAGLFRGATWLFTLVAAEQSALEVQWREAVAGFGAVVRDMKAERHDEVCAWVSHLPQMVSTALAALLEETFVADSEGLAAVQAIGGRALRETTRLGASPYSMWRDVAMTNTEAISLTLQALERRLEHIRENLRTSELREEFERANRFRAK